MSTDPNPKHSLAGFEPLLGDYICACGFHATSMTGLTAHMSVANKPEKSGPDLQRIWNFMDGLGIDAVVDYRTLDLVIEALTAERLAAIIEPHVEGPKTAEALAEAIRTALGLEA